MSGLLKDIHSLNHFRNKGGVLILVLIISTIVIMITQSAMQAAMMQFKMVNSFQGQLKKRQQIEKKLLHFEQQIEEGITQENGQEIIFHQFVPDTLHFGEKQGRFFYHLRITGEDMTYKLFSTIAVRKPSLSPDLTTQGSGSPSQDLFVPEKDFQPLVDPIMLRLLDGQRVFVAVGIFREIPEKIWLSIYALVSGALLYQIELPYDKTEKEPPLILQGVAAKSADYVDRLYFSAGEKIGKVTFPTKEDPCWHLSWWEPALNHIALAKIEDLQVGSHPQAAGTLLYVKAYQSNQQQMILALEDRDPTGFAPYFCLQSPSVDSFVLYQQRLVLATVKGIEVWDAFNGELLQQKDWEETIATEPGNQWVDLLLQQQKTPLIWIEKPREKERLIVHLAGETLKVCHLPIDDDQLGRQTWQEY